MASANAPSTMYQSLDPQSDKAKEIIKIRDQYGCLPTINIQEPQIVDFIKAHHNPEWAQEPLKAIGQQVALACTYYDNSKIIMHVKAAYPPEKEGDLPRELTMEDKLEKSNVMFDLFKKHLSIAFTMVLMHKEMEEYKTRSKKSESDDVVPIPEAIPDNKVATKEQSPKKTETPPSSPTPSEVSLSVKIDSDPEQASLLKAMEIPGAPLKPIAHVSTGQMHDSIKAASQELADWCKENDIKIKAAYSFLYPWRNTGASEQEKDAAFELQNAICAMGENITKNALTVKEQQLMLDLLDDLSISETDFVFDEHEEGWTEAVLTQLYRECRKNIITDILKTLDDHIGKFACAQAMQTLTV